MVHKQAEKTAFELINEIMNIAFQSIASTLALVYNSAFKAPIAGRIFIFIGVGLILGFFSLRFRQHALKFYTFFMTTFLLLMGVSFINPLTNLIDELTNKLPELIKENLPFENVTMVFIAGLVVTFILYLIFNNPHNIITFLLTFAVIFTQLTPLFEKISPKYALFASSIASIIIMAVILLFFSHWFTYFTDFFMCFAGAIAILGFLAGSIEVLKDFFGDEDLIFDLIGGKTGILNPKILVLFSFTAVCYY